MCFLVIAHCIHYYIILLTYQFNKRKTKLFEILINWNSPFHKKWYLPILFYPNFKYCKYFVSKNFSKKFSQNSLLIKKRSFECFFECYSKKIIQVLIRKGLCADNYYFVPKNSYSIMSCKFIYIGCTFIIFCTFINSNLSFSPYFLYVY